MKPEDIEVGKLYVYDNGYESPTILLGTGTRVLYTSSEYKNKKLTIIASPKLKLVGQNMQEGDDCQEGVWDDIKPFDLEKESVATLFNDQIWNFLAKKRKLEYSAVFYGVKKD